MTIGSKMFHCVHVGVLIGVLVGTGVSVAVGVLVGLNVTVGVTSVVGAGRTSISGDLFEVQRPELPTVSVNWHLMLAATLCVPTSSGSTFQVVVTGSDPVSAQLSVLASKLAGGFELSAT